MSTYITFNHIEQEVDQSAALDTLCHMVWLGIETTAQELSGLEHIIDYDGVAMYYQHASDTYYYVDNFDE